MKRKTSFIASSLVAIFAAASLGTSAVASPLSADGATATEMQNHRGHHRGKHHGGKEASQAALVVPGYGAVSQEFLETLALTEAQKTLLDEAQQARKSVWDDQRSRMKKARDDRQAELAAGKLDPRAKLEARQAQHAKMLAAHAEINAKWLAVWDALDAGQREKIAAHLAVSADSTSRR